MLLFHGTSRSALSQIIATGQLSPPTYLTNCADQANYFADLSAKRTASQPVVLIVETGDLQLSADFGAFEEPINIVITKRARSEKSWQHRLETGEIPYPATLHDHLTSLSIVGSAFLSKRLPVGRVWHAVSRASQGMLEAAQRQSASRAA